MKRLIVGLVAVFLLTAAVPCIPAETEHQRIERKIDRILQLLEAPKPPPIDVFPPKPEPPKDNPFIAWRAQGHDLVHIQVWILKRPLTPDELEQAYAAGYPRPGGPKPGAPGPVVGPGFDLGEGNPNPTVNVVNAGAPVGPYRVVVKAGAQRPRVSFFGSPGAFFGKLSYELRNAAGQVVRSATSVPGAIVKVVPLDGLQGVYYLTVTIDGSGPLGAQFQQ